MAATAAAPARIDVFSCPKAGSSGSGKPVGMAPWSLTRATLSSPATITTAVGTIRAMSGLTTLSGVDARPTRIRHRGEPDEQRRHVDATGMDDHIDRPDQPGVAGGRRSRQVGELAEDDVHRHAGEEAEHHRVGHEPGVPAQPQHAGDDHEPAGEQGQQGERPGAVGLVDDGHPRSGGERRRTRGRDDHQLRARAEPADQRADRAGVQARHRADAGEDAGGHPIGHVADRVRQAGDEVGAQVRLARRDTAQPTRHGRHHAHAGSRIPASRRRSPMRRQPATTRKPRFPVELSGVFELRAATR